MSLGLATAAAVGMATATRTGRGCGVGGASATPRGTTEVARATSARSSTAEVATVLGTSAEVVRAATRSASANVTWATPVRSATAVCAWARRSTAEVTRATAVLGATCAACAGTGHVIARHRTRFGMPAARGARATMHSGARSAAVILRPTFCRATVVRHRIRRPTMRAAATTRAYNTVT